MDEGVVNAAVDAVALLAKALVLAPSLSERRSTNQTLAALAKELPRVNASTICLPALRHSSLFPSSPPQDAACARGEVAGARVRANRRALDRSAFAGACRATGAVGAHDARMVEWSCYVMFETLSAGGRSGHTPFPF
jgi:hypothetical protein|tara:strand:- start:293 stop:703 length:411 start_codon:yes stop_codon:yes gene_type:complete